MAAGDAPDEQSQPGTGAAVTEVHSVAAPCAACGRQIDIYPPRSLRVAAGITGLRLSGPLAGLGEPSLCLPHRIERMPEERREQVRTAYATLVRAAGEAGIPAGSPVWPLYLDADDDNGPPAWRGFRVRFLAAEVAGLPADASERFAHVPTMRFAADNGTAFGLMVFRTRVFHTKVSASLVFWSAPGDREMRLEVRDWQRTDRLTDLQRLMRGVEIFATLARGGRPVGGTTWSKEEFLEELPRAKERFEERHGRKPADADLAAEMWLSPATFRRYKKRFLTETG